MAGVGLRAVELAGSAGSVLAAGVVSLRPEDAMVEAMLRGWRAQQAARGLQVGTVDEREKLVRRFLRFTNEFPWQWGPGRALGPALDARGPEPGRESCDGAQA